VLLRHYPEQGVGKSELAKGFGISRRTVYHWIETGQLDRDLDSQEARYRPRPPVVTQLEPASTISARRVRKTPRGSSTDPSGRRRHLRSSEPQRSKHA
jgi:transposase-like protein